MDDMQYKQEEQRLKAYEAVANREKTKDQTDLAYRDLNTRFLKMESKALKGDELSEKKKNHQEVKKRIEEAWHRNTANQAQELKKKAAAKDNTEKEYYKLFSLQEMEQLIKNSDRGGNSDEYNNVATDLELYNRVVAQEESNESMTLLKRLKESCDTYLRTRKKRPWGTNGKIRRAMIEKISEKVNEKLQESFLKLQTDKSQSYEAFAEEKTEQNVNNACKAHYDQIYHYLQGNVELTEEEKKKLDSDMKEILEAVKAQKVDDNQSDTFPTKFFNAIGWASNKPRLVNSIDGDEEENSLLKRKVYHTINTLDNQENAMEQAKQLAGISKGANRQFYSDGMFGRGTYLAVRSDKQGASDDSTSNHCWSYGENKGSVQLTMCLNEKARIINYYDLEKLTNEKLKTQFPQVYNCIKTSRSAFRNRTGEETFTILAALFGYNTVKGYAGSSDGTIDYFVTSDRKALSIQNTAEMRTGDEDDYNYVTLADKNKENKEKEEK